MDKQKVIAEIQRVAQGADSLSQSEFEERAKIGLTTVRYAFGSWNRAVEAAGLRPIPPNGSKTRQPSRSDDDYLLEIIRLTEELRKKPTEAELHAFGQYSVTPYLDRWRTFARARELAYEKYGFPQFSKE